MVSFKEQYIGRDAHGFVLDIDEILSTTNSAWYECLSSKAAFWQTDAGQKWMKTQRESKTAQGAPPFIPGAVEGKNS